MYVGLLEEKREEVTTSRDRLLNGLAKLSETNQVVESMREELKELQPVLEEKSKSVAELLEVVSKD